LKTINKNVILIIIPVYNESGRIGVLVEKLKKIGYNNVLVVDDGSDDNSGDEALVKGATVIKHLINRGVGAATETGLRFFRANVEFEFAVTIDGDNQHDPTDINYLLSKQMEENADLTIGNRFMSKENDIPNIRKFYNLIADILTSLLVLKKVSDSQSGFKAWSKKAARTIQIEQDGYDFCSEVIIKAYHHKLKIINVPINVYYPVNYSDKGQNLNQGIKTALNIIYHSLFKN
jgi:glycosyltransferase involved in cell wall biosynthesis